MQKDPSRREANLFLYSQANPVNRVDPSGLFSKQIIASSFGLPDYNALLSDEYQNRPQVSRRWGLLAALLFAESGDTLYVHGGRPFGDTSGHYTTGSVTLVEDCEIMVRGSFGVKTIKEWANHLGSGNQFTLFNPSKGVTGHFTTGSDDRMTTLPDFIYYGVTGGMPSAVIPFASNMGAGRIILDRFGSLYLAGEVSMSVSVSADDIFDDLKRDLGEGDLKDFMARASLDAGFGWIDTPGALSGDMRHVPVSQDRVQGTLTGLPCAFASISVGVPNAGLSICTFAEGFNLSGGSYVFTVGTSLSLNPAAGVNEGLSFGRKVSNGNPAWGWQDTIDAQMYGINLIELITQQENVHRFSSMYHPADH